MLNENIACSGTGTFVFFFLLNFCFTTSLCAEQRRRRKSDTFVFTSSCYQAETSSFSTFNTGRPSGSADDSK